MTDKILEIVALLKIQRDRIDAATDKVMLTTSGFAEYQNAVDELDIAICDLKSAARHVRDAEIDSIIWQLNA